MMPTPMRTENTNSSPVRGIQTSMPTERVEVGHARLNRSLRDDSARFEGMVRTELPRLLALLRPLLRDEEDSRDVAARALQMIRPEETILAADTPPTERLRWTAIELALWSLRARHGWAEKISAGRLPAFLPDGHHQGGSTTRPAHPLESPPSPATRRRTRAAIDTLPEASRAVLILCDREGLGTDEVARLMAEPPPAVRQRLHQARQALLQLMQSMTPSEAIQA